MVAVAQQVEHQIVVLVVVGSKPIGHPPLNPENYFYRAFFCSIFPLPNYFFLD